MKRTLLMLLGLFYSCLLYCMDQQGSTTNIPSNINKITCKAAPNIAVIKYWGKRNDQDNLPSNGSISVTLDDQDLCTRTTVILSPTFKSDSLILNTFKHDLSGKIKRMIQFCRQFGKKSDQYKKWYVKIDSVNNFPTAAGLASSASGLACLSYALCSLFDVPQDNNYSLWTQIARIGSGSASRSIHGGIVEWKFGKDAELTKKLNQFERVANDESYAQPILHALKDMRILICVVNEGKKKISSSVGMQQTVKTSPLFQKRIVDCVPQRLKEMKAAVTKGNWEKFLTLTMQDSNQFHATCLDTSPPIFYLNDTSRLIIDLCHQINKEYNRVVVGYTFDAGPNAVLFFKKSDFSLVFGIFSTIFKDVPAESYNKRLQDKLKLTEDLSKNLEQWNSLAEYAPSASSVKRFIYTKIGNGASIVSK